MVDAVVPKPAKSNHGIYLVTAHPRWRDSRITRRLLAAARAQAAGTSSAPLDIQDLYASYPDYFVDARAERARLARAAMLVLLHPLSWSSMPPLQKIWLDDVLTYGWAHGPASAIGDARQPAPAGVPGTALRGKHLWLVASCGENGHEGDFLAPYRHVAAHCGMNWLPPLILGDAGTATREQIEAHVQVFRERLATYPAWA